MGIEIAPAFAVSPNTFASKIPKKGESPNAALIFRDPAGVIESVDSTGRFTPQYEINFGEHAPITGLEAVKSFAAALAWAMSEVLHLDPRSFPDIYRILFERRLPNRGETRRAAIEFARAGLIDFLPHLALTNTEISWWTCLANIRRGDLATALNILNELPDNRYPIRHGLKKSLEDELGIRVASRDAKACLASNDGKSQQEFRYLARAVGIDSRVIEQIATDRLPTSAVEIAPFETPATLRFLENIRQGSSVRHEIQISPLFNLSLLDDLIDAGVKFSDSAFSSFEGEARSYLQARTAPEKLTDEEVESLVFNSEKVRRKVAVGELADLTDMAEIPNEVRLRAVFVRDRVVTEEIREEMPQWAEAIETFCESGKKDSKIPIEISGDAMLWNFAADLLNDAVIREVRAPDDVTRQFLSWACLKYSMKCLYERDTTGAINAAKSALLQAVTEQMKDEALNLIACAHWIAGRDSEAVSALQTALEGRRNISLQVNLGVVATTSNPETAALELARLVAETDSLELRSNAAIRAAGIWLRDDNPWKSDVTEGMPSAIRDALRKVIVEAIPIETFVYIARVLVAQDSKWMAERSNLTRSPHFGTVEARVLCARAAGLDTFVQELTGLLKHVRISQWVLDERDSFVEGVIEQAISDPNLGAGLFIFNAFDGGLPVLPRHRLALVPVAVLEMCAILDTDDGEPHDKFYNQLLSAESELNGHEDFARWKSAYDMAWKKLIVTHCLANHKRLVHLVQVHNSGVEQISNIPVHQIDREAVKRFFRPVLLDLQAIESSLRRFVSRANDVDTQKLLSDILKDARELRILCQQNMG